MRFGRRYTPSGNELHAALAWRRLGVAADFLDLELVGRIDIEIPADWPRSAGEALAQLDLLHPAVPSRLQPVPEDDVPRWLWRSTAEPGAPPVAEHSARQLFDRMAGAWCYWGWKGGYFDSEADARTFRDELRFMLGRRMVLPDLPHWQSTGLHWAYGIGPAGTASGYVVDFVSGKMSAAGPHHLPPQGTAIGATDGALDGSAGTMALWASEAAALRSGLVTGVDASAVGRGGDGDLRGHLRIGEAVAAAAMGDAPARRLSRLIALDADHPDSLGFVDWKAEEEHKLAALSVGSAIVNRHIGAIAAACHGTNRRRALDPSRNPALRLALNAAREAMIPERAIDHALALIARNRGMARAAVFDTDWDGEGARTVSAQRARHVVRFGREALEQPDAAGPGGQAWRRMGRAAWQGGDSGVLFADALAEWHTCPAAGDIRATGPDGDYAFVDGTACAAAFVNLAAFATEGGGFDVAGFEHAVRLFVVALDISVQATAQNSPALADGVWRFRPLGLAPTNLAERLLAAAIPYDSDAGRAVAAATCALMTGAAYAASAEMAGGLGCFPAHAENRESMLRVVGNHRRAALGRRDGYEGLSWPPQALDPDACPEPALAAAAARAWDRALALGEAHGFRNAQVTMVATGEAVRRLAASDGCGIGPERSLVKFQPTPGGGFARVIHSGFDAALTRLGYGAEARRDIVRHVVGHGTLRGAPAINPDSLRARGLDDLAIAVVEDAIAHVSELRFAFTRYTLGDAQWAALGLPPEGSAANVLATLGFSPEEIDCASIYACGALTVQGAPGLSPADVAVFDCALSPRAPGRELAAEARLRMMAAVQPMVSGGVAGPLTLPARASVEDCQRAYLTAWRLGLKGLMLDREGSRLADPLALRGADATEAELPDGVSAPLPPEAVSRRHGRFVVVDGGATPGRGAAGR